ncbi:MAG: helix-turn-helix transcriptional regulator, partial [Planctomycetota bacterium]|nr:helix-turn-helix transcriptional regulator [Planctomycetota bacterium]
MLYLSNDQKKHVVVTISRKRRELFGYRGGNRDLALRLGVSPQLVSMWACNKRFPSHRELLLLTEVFNITLDELCCLNKRHDRANARRPKKDDFSVTHAEAKRTILDICSITEGISKMQRQML